MYVIQSICVLKWKQLLETCAEDRFNKVEYL